jgi:hypothetical protein
MAVDGMSWVHPEVAKLRAQWAGSVPGRDEWSQIAPDAVRFEPNAEFRIQAVTAA